MGKGSTGNYVYYVAGHLITCIVLIGFLKYLEDFFSLQQVERRWHEMREQQIPVMARLDKNVVYSG